MSDWKERLGVVYSTNSEFQYNKESENKEQETLEKSKQNLRISLDKKQRAGKKVTIVSDFKGATTDLTELGKTLKTKCGVGGAVKDGLIIIQGDFRDRVLEILLQMGYKARKI